MGSGRFLTCTATQAGQLRKKMAGMLRARHNPANRQRVRHQADALLAALDRLLDVAGDVERNRDQLLKAVARPGGSGCGVVHAGNQRRQTEDHEMTTDEQGLPLQLLSASEASRTLAISPRTLWAISAPRGPLPVVRIGPAGRSVRYHLADLERFIESQKVGCRP
jgi:hypothetical protein